MKRFLGYTKLTHQHHWHRNTAYCSILRTALLTCAVGLAIALSSSLLLPSYAVAQLRIVSYNTTPTLSDELGAVLVGIGEQAVNGVSRPVDIVALQEQVSLQEETQAVVDMLNAVYGDGAYARGVRTGTGFTTQGVVYNTQTVQLIDERTIGRVSFQGNARHTLRYRFRPVGYDFNSDFYIYNSHLKANDNDQDAARRAVEAASNRADATSLGDSASVIYLGDLNLYRDTEPAYQALIEAGTAQAFDPIDRPGRWTRNPRYREVHTQSTTVAGGNGRSGGGVNDRFDFQLVTAPLMDGEGMSYIGPSIPNLSDAVQSESYRVFGNDGSHFASRDISTGSAESQEMLERLERVSDHLPVVVDYQLPARMTTEIEVLPSRVIQGAELVANVMIQNSAPVDYPVGSDELNYQIQSDNFLASGEIHASDDITEVAVPLTTDRAGTHAASLDITALSDGVPEPQRSFELEYEVVAQGQASFAPTELVTNVEIDLGSRSADDRGFEVDLFHLAEPGIPTAGVMLSTGENPDVELLLPTELLGPGGQMRLQGSIAASLSGQFDTQATINVLDEALLGAGEPRTVIVRVRGSFESGQRFGDFNNDEQIDIADLDALNDQIRFGNADLDRFDLNEDGLVDLADQQKWIAEAAGTWLGDANLDGEFDSSDLVAVFQLGVYLA